MTQDTQSKTTFTPGPWEIQDGSVYVSAYKSPYTHVDKETGEERTAYTGLVALVYGNIEFSPTAYNCDANAHLISAAPLLYARLEEVVELAGITYGSELGCRDCLDCQDEEMPCCATHALIRDARAALAAARGEQP